MGRRFPDPLVLAIVSMLAGAAFVFLAILVRFSLTDRVDLLADRVAARLDGPRVQLVGELLTEIGRIEITLLCTTLLAVILWWRGRKPWALAVLLIFVTVIVEVASKELLFMPRREIAGALQSHPRRLPFEVIGLFADPRNAPYPSGHMARAVFLSGLALWIIATRVRSNALATSLLVSLLVFLGAMGFTRVSELEHPFSDVVGGTFLALALLPWAWWLLERGEQGRPRP
jgi:membrane-associated phospholipid phosphatase